MQKKNQNKNQNKNKKTKMKKHLQWELSITKKMIKSFQKRVHWM